MKRFPNPFVPTPRHSNICGCGDPAGNFTYCSQSCAEIAYYATTCGEECDCESLATHEEAQAEAEREFLRNPGSPPAHFTAGQTERAWAGITEARRKEGL